MDVKVVDNESPTITMHRMLRNVHRLSVGVGRTDCAKSSFERALDSLVIVLRLFDHEDH
jgi:hypothetical protein